MVAKPYNRVLICSSSLAEPWEMLVLTYFMSQILALLSQTQHPAALGFSVFQVWLGPFWSPSMFFFLELSSWLCSDVSHGTRFAVLIFIPRALCDCEAVWFMSHFLAGMNVLEDQGLSSDVTPPLYLEKCLECGRRPLSSLWTERMKWEAVSNIKECVAVKHLKRKIQMQGKFNCPSQTLGLWLLSFEFNKQFTKAQSL